MSNRITREAALQHPARGRILDWVKADPGITFRALSRHLGIPQGTLRHHLNVLERCKLLREERVEGTIAFLPANDLRRARQVTILREPAMVALRDLVASAGRICQRDLITYLDGIWNRSTVQNRLKRLVRAGVLRVHPQGRHSFYEVA